VQLREKKNKGNKWEDNKLEGNKSEGTNPNLEALVAAEATYEKALKAIEAAKLAVTTAGTKPFELGKNHQCPSDLRSLGRHKGGRAHGDSY
jgi:hydroxymethylpyrimidine/phosphomethylpyrimidine kinase